MTKTGQRMAGKRRWTQEQMVQLVHTYMAYRDRLDKKKSNHQGRLIWDQLVQAFNSQWAVLHPDQPMSWNRNQVPARLQCWLPAHQAFEFASANLRQITLFLLGLITFCAMAADQPEMGEHEEQAQEACGSDEEVWRQQA